MPKNSFPDFVPPMLATSANKPFDSPDWIFEVKLDGYRGIAVFDAVGKSHLWSRNGLSLEQKFPAIAKALSELKLRSTILDGEVVAIDEQEIPRFQPLQRFQKQPTAPTIFYVFDLLWSDGSDVMGKPVLERKEILERTVGSTTRIQVGAHVDRDGKALFEMTKEKGMEGIIAKKKSSIYLPGKRTSDWLKIKARPQQEFVVGGFTEGKGSRQRTFGALLLGAYQNGRLHYFGHSGTGFSDKVLDDALRRMQPLFTEKSPFDNPPKVKEKIQRIKPKLVCEVAFAEMTADEQLRQDDFLGLEG